MVSLGLNSARHQEAGGGIGVDRKGALGERTGMAIAGMGHTVYLHRQAVFAVGHVNIVNCCDTVDIGEGTDMRRRIDDKVQVIRCQGCASPTRLQGEIRAVKNRVVLKCIQMNNRWVRHPRGIVGVPAEGHFGKIIPTVRIGVRGVGVGLMAEFLKVGQAIVVGVA